jgi:rod shape-determining protein MreC
LTSFRRTFALFVVLSLLHVILISSQVQSRSGVPLIQAAAFGVFASVQHLTSGVADMGRSFWSNYVALQGVAAENDALERKVLELEGIVQAQAAIVSQTRELEDILRLQQSLVAPTLAARVIAGSPAPGADMITIDRGSADGVEVDMAVLGHLGVVGRVLRTTSSAAQVQLLIGRNAAAAAFTGLSLATGIVQGGAGNPPLELQYVDVLKDVRVGEHVYTSGIDGIFPRGFLIGTVERAVKGSGVYSDLAVRPAVDFTRLDVVLVVLARPARETGALVAGEVRP